MSHLVRHEKPEDSLNKLEEVSYLLKHEELADKFLKTKETRDYSKPGDESVKQATNETILKAKGLFKFVEKKPAGEDGAEAVDEPVPAINFLPDLRGDCKIFEWAGVSFGEYDVMLLQKSLQAHIVASGASSMRFWGKIRGSKADYYVAEG